jgi:endonuclease III
MDAWSVGEVVGRLRRAYGSPRHPRRLDPLSELICTILSQNTSDTNSRRAFDSLRDAYPTWEAVAKAPTRRVAEAIRSGGLANIKAPRIQAVLEAIGARRGRLSLDYLLDMTPDQARHELAGFKGVGPKTVACVLLFACDMPVLPVDTHVHRVALRLGLIPPKTGAAKAHVLLEAVVPARQVFAFHVLLIRHGREVCHARRAQCGVCTLAKKCPARAEPS